MMALSILQPWAWLIVNGFKDVENRGWHTNYRGRVLVHAGKKYGPRIHAEDVEEMRTFFRIDLPPFDQMQIGGIVGETEIYGCVRDSKSKWASADCWHFQLRNSKPLPFEPYRGQLGFFRVEAVGGGRG